MMLDSLEPELWLLAIPMLYLMLTQVASLLIGTVGRSLLMDTLYLERISGYLLQNLLKVETSLLYRKPCLTSLWVSLWCLVCELW